MVGGIRRHKQDAKGEQRKKLILTWRRVFNWSLKDGYNFQKVMKSLLLNGEQMRE